MPQMLIRDLNADVKLKLERRARRHGVSTVEEVRRILANAVREEDSPHEPLGSRIARRFAGRGLGAGEAIPELRDQPARPADLEP